MSGKIDPRLMLRDLALLLRECAREAVAHEPSRGTEEERADVRELGDQCLECAENLEELARETDDRRVFGVPGQIAYAACMGQLEAAREQLPRRKLAPPSESDMALVAATFAARKVPGSVIMNDPDRAAFELRAAREELEGERGRALDRVLCFWVETSEALVKGEPVPKLAPFEPIDTGARFPAPLVTQSGTCTQCRASRLCARVRVVQGEAMKLIPECCAECMADLIVGCRRFPNSSVFAQARRSDGSLKFCRVETMRLVK